MISDSTKPLNPEGKPANSLVDLLRTLEPIEDDFPEFDDPPPKPVEFGTEDD